MRRILRAIITNLFVFAPLFLFTSSAVATLQQEAPAVVIDLHCHQEDFPNFWAALRAMQLQKGELKIDADLALADVYPFPGEPKGNLRIEPNRRPYDPATQREFLDNCLLALLREHVRPVLDKALLLLVKQTDLRNEDRQPAADDE
jgi:hypothetical protein